MKKIILITLALAAIAAFVLSPPGAAIAQEVTSVFVTNFPKVFNVSGAVTATSRPARTCQTSPVPKNPPSSSNE